MKNINNILSKDLFSVNKFDKKKFFLREQINLTKHHLRKSKKYKNIIGKLNLKLINSIDELPFLSVNLFKETNITSISEAERFKTLNSSGTSGKKSQIFLDKITSHLQQETLVKITKNFIGNKRYPMLIIENEKILKKNKAFSARTAAILGFSIFGKEKCFALNDKLLIDNKKINSFLQKYKDETILIFGFTFQIWKYLALTKNNLYIKNNCIVLHGGGWKKMTDNKVNESKFKNELIKKINLTKLINYYGMVEQVGSIFMQCPEGYFHCSNMSDIIIRNENFNSLPIKHKGMIQMLSLLPLSYPGHNILTEDLGIVHGEDNCKCGRSGKYFSILGRIPSSEVRGCSDTGNS